MANDMAAALHPQTQFTLRFADQILPPKYATLSIQCHNVSLYFRATCLRSASRA